jgi:hypothetical protein
MRATSWERDIAIGIVEQLIGHGLAAQNYTKTSASYSLWDWMDREHLFENGFSYADGATKAVIFHSDLDSYVIKFRLPCEAKDYCARELANYTAAEEAGLSYYFAATEYLCEREGIVFYLQEQVICDEEVDSELCEKLQCQYDESGTSYDMDSLWYDIEEMSASERVLLLYGSKELADFINDRRINDLHCGNFGLDGDHYVMIDYSGFGSGVWETEV